MFIRKILLISILLVTVIGFLIVLAPKASSDAKSVNLTFDTVSYLERELPDLCEGDLVFRKGRSMVSKIVLMHDRASAYSHVGIVAFINGEPFIVHAVPGEPDENGEERVKCESPVDFLDVERASLFAVFRIAEDEKHMAKIAGQKAVDYYEMGLSFDKALDFRSDDKLYCTELVWKAYLEAGINLTGNKFHVLTLNLLTDSIILPGQFIESKLLTQIYPLSD